MPWKECHVMDERLRFVARLLEGEKMAPLCAEFGISRKTGYKIFDRYKDCGVAAFTDRSRRPYRQANRLPAPIEATIVRLKREYPGWGAPKIREKLRQQVDRRRTCRRSARSTRCSIATAWCTGGAGAGTRRPGTDALAADRAECAVVRRLQRRVHARQSALLLSADDHRLRQPLPADLRGAVDDAGAIRLHRLRAHVQGVWAAAGDPHRQRRAVRVGRTRSTASASCRSGGSASAFRSSASSPGHPAAKRPARAHASDAEEGSHQAGRARMSCSSRRASMPSSSATTRSGRIRR